jgi:uncharacterized membrane protein YeaQ/YmgE (transglycosylase-associated protein family)
MGFLSWVIFGLLAGGLAKFIMPGKDPGGCLVTALIGIIGSVIGGFLGTRLFHFGKVQGFDLRSLLIAILGSIVLLVLFRLVFARRRPPKPE